MQSRTYAAYMICRSRRVGPNLGQGGGRLGNARTDRVIGQAEPSNGFVQQPCPACREPERQQLAFLHRQLGEATAANGHILRICLDLAAPVRLSLEQARGPQQQPHCLFGLLGVRRRPLIDDSGVQELPGRRLVSRQQRTFYRVERQADFDGV
jgi:hypothetical protein